jgi:hypothetical protein
LTVPGAAGRASWGMLNMDGRLILLESPRKALLTQDFD